MNSEEQKLYLELKKLAKRANQRLLRMERLTGKQGLFASKQLYDYLETVNGVSKTGRVRVSQKFNESELIAMIKATKDFLEDTKNSTVTELKKQKKKIEASIGKSISWEQLSTLYTASELYEWANEEFGSKFWKDFAPLVFVKAKNEWVEYCENYLENINDKTIHDRLLSLYDYLKE